MQEVKFIECVAERDIDLLLLEELHVSSSFCVWVFAQAFGLDHRCGRLIGAWHSVIHPRLGESDLIALLEDGQGGTKALLIENKIDALPQPEQASRYHLRGEAGVSDRQWSTYHTCIVAPQKYLVGTADAAKYDIRLPYESLREWFRRSDPADLRSHYRAKLLDAAIEQSRRGYQPVPHPGVTKFWLDYWRLVTAEFPQLPMKMPGQIPADSDWPVFRGPVLGAGRVIRHKLAAGVVDLEIASAGGVVDEIATRNRGLLQSEFAVVRTGKSASVRAMVPKVDRFGDVSSQLESVRAGLSAASQLLSLSARINAS